MNNAILFTILSNVWVRVSWDTGIVLKSSNITDVLNAKEMKLFKTFADAPNKAFTYEELGTLFNIPLSKFQVASLVAQLRRKIEPYGTGPNSEYMIIVTIEHVGYKMIKGEEIPIN